jgi:hypothetical protein
MLIKHPLNIEKRMYPIQDVLRDLANQEHGDGVPYDQMVMAADYIDSLENTIKSLKEVTTKTNDKQKR